MDNNSRAISDEARKQFVHHAAGAILRAADRTRNTLSVDERTYRNVASYAHSSARHYVIYATLDVADQFAVVLFRLRELFGSSDDSPVPDDTNGRVGRNTLAAINTEIEVWLRRLRELYVDLLLFKTTNADEHYRLYLLHAELRAYRDLKRDFDEFYACSCKNVQGTIEELESRKSALESRLPASTRWYDNSSFRKRLMRALESSHVRDKLLLGRSYEHGYQGPSRSIHASIGGPQYERSEERCWGFGIGIAFIAARVISLCRELLSLEADTELVTFEDQLRESESSRKAESELTPNIAAGDFVLMYGSLARVTKVNVSRYGYTSINVRYLEAPPRPGELEECMPAIFVHKLFDKEEYLRKTRDALDEMQGQLSVGQLNEAIEKSIVHLWNNGLADHYRGDPAGAKEKLKKLHLSLLSSKDRG